MHLKTIKISNFGSIEQLDSPLELQRFNLFIGENNSGKSTILRTIPFLSDALDGGVGGNRYNQDEVNFVFSPSWRTRYDQEDSESFFNATNTENRPIIEYRFDDGEIKLLINGYQNKDKLSAKFQINPIGFTVPKGVHFRIIKPFRKLGLSKHNADALDIDGGRGIDNLRQLQHGNPKERAAYRKLEMIVKKLLIPDYTGFLLKNDNIYIEEGSQQLPLNKYGAAVEEIIIILLEILVIYEPSIFSLEEPECHLHPKLLREFMNFLRDETDHQYLISAHSTVLVDWMFGNEDSTVFSLSKVNKKLYISPLRKDDDSLISELFIRMGVKSSDILYSNYVIWVEGPADRIYYNKLIEVYCKENKVNVLKEGNDYSFISYGAILANLKDIYRINRNSTVEFLLKSTILSKYKMLDDKGNVKKYLDKVAKATRIASEYNLLDELISEEHFDHVLSTLKVMVDDILKVKAC